MGPSGERFGARVALLEECGVAHAVEQVWFWRNDVI